MVGRAKPLLVIEATLFCGLLYLFWDVILSKDFLTTFMIGFCLGFFGTVYLAVLICYELVKIAVIEYALNIGCRNIEFAPSELDRLLGQIMMLCTVNQYA